MTGTTLMVDVAARRSYVQKMGLRSVRRGLFGAVTVSAALAAGVLTSFAGARAHPYSCGHFTAQGYTWDVTVKKGNVKCRAARQVLRAFVNGKGNSTARVQRPT
jgi:hypothetical protein